MIIHSMTLQNFRAYRGAHTLDLTPESPTQPIILVTGLNGAGKTTLLEALNLALYGKLSPMSRGSQRAYEDYLRGCIHDDLDEEAAVSLVLSHTVQGEKRVYEICRSWRKTPRSVREDFTVVCNDEFSTTFSEDWAQLIEEILPSRLAPLFFFDGERIEALADAEATADTLSVAIHSLLGIDIVNQLKNDLEALERRKRVDMPGDAGERQELQGIENEIRDLEELTAKADAARAEVNDELAKARRRLRDADRRFEAQGGSAYESRKEIERKDRELRAELAQSEDSLRDLAGGLAPLLLVEPLLERVVEQAARERKVRESHVIGTLLEERDGSLLDHLRNSGADDGVIHEAQKFLGEDRTQRKPTEDVQLYLNMSEAAEQQAGAVLQTALPMVRKQVAEALERHERIEQEVEESRKRVESIPEADAIRKLQTRRKEAQHQVHELEKELAAIEKEHEIHATKLEQSKALLESKLNQEYKQNLVRADIMRVLMTTMRTRKTLEEFRISVLSRHIDRIQSLVLEGFQKLVRKISLVSALEIDPKDYRLLLYGRNGVEMATEDLSAGERQLLAIALLWGLARASRRPIPTVIDTPLGRLDSTHRMHLVRRYFPYASHQVILLSTDQEISGQYLDELRKRIGKSYVLVYEDETRFTEILEGFPGEIDDERDRESDDSTFADGERAVDAA